MLSEPVAQLGLSVRTANALDNEGIHTIGDLLECCPRRMVDCELQECPCRKSLASDDPLKRSYEPRLYLLDMANFGVKTLEEVYAKLVELGFPVRRAGPPLPHQY